MSNSMVNDLTQGRVARQLILFTLPLAASNLLQVLYNLVDMIVIGRFVGSTGLSGVSIGGDLMHIPMFIGIGFSGAAQIIVAQLVGKKDREGVNRAIGTSFSFILGMSLVCTALFLIFRNQLLDWMNTPAEARQQALNYSVVCFWGMFFIFGYNAVSAILRGMGDSTRPFVFIGVATVVNVVLDLVFVGLMQLDAMGAALATVIGQAVSFVGSLIYLYRRREQFGFDFKPASFRIDRSVLLPLVKLGVPMMLQSMAITISSLFVNAWVNAYGVTASAVTAVGGKLRNTASVITNSLCTATASMTGQNMGAGRIDRVRRTVGVSVLINAAAFVLWAVAFLAFPRQIFGFFTTDPEVLDWARTFMYTNVVSILCMCMMSSFNGLITGVGNATLSFIIGMLDGVVARVGIALLLGRVMGMGILGFWWGNALAGFFTAIPGIVYYFTGRWEHRELVVR